MDFYNSELYPVPKQTDPDIGLIEYTIDIPDDLQLRYLKALATFLDLRQEILLLAETQSGDGHV